MLYERAKRRHPAREEERPHPPPQKRQRDKNKDKYISHANTNEHPQNPGFERASKILKISASRHQRPRTKTLTGQQPRAAKHAGATHPRTARPIKIKTGPRQRGEQRKKIFSRNETLKT